MKSTVTINLDPLLRSLNTLERKNLPYASALALNETAFQAKDRLVALMPSQFDLRSSRPVKGFRVSKAHKTQNIQEASVYHLDPWMALHEFGGTKTPTKGRTMGVPAAVTREQGRSASGAIREKWWPRNLKKTEGFADPAAAGRMGGRGNKGKGAPKAFLLVSRGGDKKIVKRTSKTGDRYDLIDLYYLEKSVKVAPRWNYFDTVKDVARQHLAPNFERALFKSTAFRG